MLQVTMVFLRAFLVDRTSFAAENMALKQGVNYVLLHRDGLGHWHLLGVWSSGGGTVLHRTPIPFRSILRLRNRHRSGDFGFEQDHWTVVR